MIKSLKAFAVLGLGVYVIMGLLLVTRQSEAPAQAVALSAEANRYDTEAPQAEDIQADTKALGNSTLDRLLFDYQPTPIDIVNNDPKIQFNYAPGSFLRLDGQAYELLQFYFHVPNGHIVESPSMEAHLVHRNIETGDLAVVAVTLEVGEKHTALKSIWPKLPKNKGLTIQLPTVKTDATALLPTDTQDFYRYYGSLTTSGCSETVSWIMMRQPVQVSVEQVNYFTSIADKNVQPVREISQHLCSISLQY